MEQLAIFTRYPEPGLAKTRLIDLLGEEGAAALQRELTEKTVEKVDQLMKTSTVEPVIYFEGGDLAAMQSWLGEDRRYEEQAGGDLGEKLSNAFENGFSSGAERVVAVGCDCPGLTREHIGRAFDALYMADVVMGPAADGGYYLIGMKHPVHALFEDIPWGTDRVFETTFSLVRQLGLTLETLEELSDVDRPKDLKNFDYHPNSQ